ncbi:hypothetical protein K432DRAFT_354779 [Lepidopterella palustris CBS 459.81]|uniref:Dynamin family protein n=1 Tax=Lepidopterella palustris CBS 459.81 TaxID=1314670 RepID=A0A8E2JEX5_9PEZI|nr:hypothetical protein K432DRAFT_354779 [Lepidopterella palustris CBS 459.81]
MADRSSEEHALQQLQSEQSEILDVIDGLRTLGLGRLVDLPQLIVCGDQSSGKSSVLEAISRVRFPTKVGLCTRFATELILRRSPSEKVKVTIESGQSRTNEEEKKRLREFSAPFSKTTDLPELINAATQWMGISPSDNSGAGFSDDVLRVEISGPDKPELSLVDLPGLYRATNEDQGSKGIPVVRDLLNRYMKNSRSIILAVVSARYEYVLQEIVDLAELHDSKHERTLGIITKPDSLTSNSEDEDFYIRLANNEKVRLQLGWHTLRNRGSEDRNTSDNARDDKERDFFSTGRWANVPRELVGVETLRPRLSRVLLDHIRRNLPQLINEIQDKIHDRKGKLEKLGDERSTQPLQRGYLLDISSRFEKITGQAINGMYLDAFFGDPFSSDPFSSSFFPEKRNLRAVIRRLNGDFVMHMSLYGRRRRIIDNSTKERASDGRLDSPTGVETRSEPDSEEDCITRTELEKEITAMALVHRGIELPGNPNPLLVGKLFRDQSKPWEKIAYNHLMIVWGTVKDFVESLLQHLTNDHTCRLLQRKILDPALENMKQSLLRKLEELVAYYKKGHPLTLDEKFLVSIRELQKDSQTASFKTTLLEKYPGANSEKGLTIEETLTAYSAAKPQSNQCAADIIDLVETYYNIASTTFIDNVVILAIENCLVQPLESIFTTQTVNQLHHTVVTQLAAEPTYVQANRNQFKSDLEKLEAGLRTCNSFNIQGSQNRNLHALGKCPTGSFIKNIP